MTPEAPEVGARSRWPVVVGACVAIAAASLAVPATLGFDPWAWLVWGREVGRGTLDTTGGPSWKPLPIALTVPLAPLGDLAVPLYAVLARTASLLAVVAVARLARRLGGAGAAVLATAALVLTPDGEPRFLRLVLEGHEAPWSAGLAVAALLALAQRRMGAALACTWLLALLRPEAWPFLLALVAWTWPVSGTARRRAGAAALAGIPVLWFVPDWVGSGSPLHGAGTAQVLAEDPLGTRIVESVATGAGMVPLPVWALAAVSVVLARRRGDRMPVLLASAALAWSALVVAMAIVLGYAAISRFFLPASAVLVALAGAGAVDVLRAVRVEDRRRSVAAAVLAVLAVALVVPRVAGIPAVLDEVADRRTLADDLRSVIDEAGGDGELAACGTVVVTARSLLRSAAAWELDLPLRAIGRAVPDRDAVLLLQSVQASERARATPGTVELAAVGEWTAFGVGCPEPIDR